MPVGEQELREFMRGYLGARSAAGESKLFEELGIERGSARVDLALVGKLLEAFELKSDADDFGRMHNQIHAYNRVFDQITLVTGPAMCGAAMSIVPSWWGVWTVRRGTAGQLILKKIRAARPNPAQEPQSLADLLWRDEAAQILVEAACGPLSKRATRSDLCASLLRHVDVPTLKRHVAQRLVARRPALKAEPLPSGQDGDSLHRDASYSDFHFLA